MGSVTSELEEEDMERAERIVWGGACPDWSTRSSSAVSSTTRGSKSTTLAVCKIERVNDQDINGWQGVYGRFASTLWS